MRTIDADAMTQLYNTIESEGIPVEKWATDQATIHIDGADLIFRTVNEKDAERMLYAFMELIRHDCAEEVLGGLQASLGETANGFSD